MDRRITIALAAILVLLGGYIWYTFLRADAPPITPVTPEPTAILFLSVAQAQVQTIEVRDVKNNQVTRVVRAGDTWRMEQPAQGEAFFARVDRLVFQLSRVTVDRKIASTDLAAFGLDAPQYQVNLTLQDGSAVSLQIGDPNPDGNYSYAMKNGDAAVYLIRASLSQEIQEFVTMPPYTPTPTATREPIETPQATPTP